MQTSAGPFGERAKTVLLHAMQMACGLKRALYRKAVDVVAAAAWKKEKRRSFLWAGPPGMVEKKSDGCEVVHDRNLVFGKKDQIRLCRIQALSRLNNQRVNVLIVFG